MSLEDKADNNLTLNILGWLSHHEQIPPVFKKPFGYVDYDAWVKEGKTEYTRNGLWVEYEGDAGASCNFADFEDLIHYARGVLGLKFRGGLSATRVLPPPSTFESFDCWLHGGKMWVVDHKGKWIRVTIPDVEEGEMPPLKEIGNADNNKELPSAWDYKPGDGFYWRGDWWMVDYYKTWVKYKTHCGNDSVTTGQFDDGMDAGSMARQLMEHKAELKRLKRSRLINKLAMWFVFLGVLVALGIAAYGYIQRDLKSGFDTTFRECEIIVGELKITGKRTYSYPYKALWGQRWVDETRVRESTTINLPGVKLAIVADAEPKWWGLRFSDGERGSPILKPALKYTLVTDKGIAMMSYGGFCKPANSLPTADDSKSPERTIIN